MNCCLSSARRFATVGFFSRRRSASLGSIGLLGLLLLSGGPARTQEAVRMSLASAEAAEARRKAASIQNYYNLKLGPTAWTFTGGLGIDADDNIRLESTNPKSDIIFRPEINTRMALPLSEVNSLNLALGTGYSAYLEHSGYDRFYITPGSELSFDMYLGDFWFNLHDRIDITENSYQDPTVVGSADYSQLENAVGVGGTWDLNKVVVRAGFDHVNYVSLQGNAGPPNGQSEVFSSSAGYALRPGTIAGVDVGGALIHYDQTSGNYFFTDASQVSAGGFVDSKISQYLRGRANVGYLVFTPETGNLLTNFTDLSGVYFQLSLSHRLNQYLEHSLSGGRTLNFSFYGGTVDLYFARWLANWNVLHGWMVGTSIEYEHGSQLGVQPEIFDRVGPRLSLGRPITAKLSGSLAYQYYWRGSDLADHDYAVNVLTLSLAYRF